MIDFEKLLNAEVNASDIGESGTYFYNPYASKAKSGVYKAKIRFLINPRDPKNSIVSKYCYFLRDDDGTGKYYDSATTIEKECPIHEVAQRLRNGSEQDKAIANKNLNRSAKHFALVQIIEDKNEPNLEGTVQIWGFGQTIMNMIKKSGGASELFHYLRGKEFKLEISKKEDKNYFKASKFVDSSTPLVIKGKTFEANQEGFKLLEEYFENIPKLEVCAYKPWDKETEEKVMERLKSFDPPAPINKPQTSTDEKSEESTDVKPLFDKVETESEEDLDGFLNNLEL